MALGIPTGGNRTPIVKYDARAGRWFRVDGKDQIVDVSNGFAAVFDLSQIEIGWAKFATGMAPDVQMARVPAPMPAQPTADHKRAVRLHVKLAKSIGGDMRELMTQAGIVMAAIDQLHDAYMAAPEAKEGKLPVVACPTTEAVTISTGAGKSTNYKPVLQIVSWVARPADLPLTSAPAAQPSARAAARWSSQWPEALPEPPRPAPPPPALGDDTEF